MAWDHSSPYVHAACYLTAAATRNKPIIGTNNYCLLIEFKNSQWRYCGRITDGKSEWEELGNLVLEKLNDERFFENVCVEERKACEKLKDFSVKIKTSGLSELSNHKLADTYSELMELWLNMNAWGDAINLADFGHFMLTNKLISLFEERISATNSKLTAGEAFGVFGTPEERSYLQQQELDFFNILAEIERSEKSKKLFTRDDETILKYLSTFENIDSLLDEQVEKYDWMQFHYDGPTILGKEYFVDLLRSEVKQKVDGKAKINEMKEHEKEILERKKLLVRELHLTKEQQYWCEIASSFTYLKGLRKDVVFLASRNSDPLIREIAKRLNLSPKQVRHMMPNEIESALKEGIYDPDLLNERIKLSIFIADEKGPRLLSGKEAQFYAERIIEEKVNADLKELKGTPAYPGFVTGIVKLIHKAEDMAKMNQGDILVSPATNPNVVPAMKKAAAIVTDEGGVTCHAAIVSREMKIPCIIGTKIATKVFEDGDKVEVDAKKGIIRKI